MHLLAEHNGNLILFNAAQRTEPSSVRRNE